MKFNRVLHKASFYALILSSTLAFAAGPYRYISKVVDAGPYFFSISSHNEVAKENQALFAQGRKGEFRIDWAKGAKWNLAPGDSVELGGWLIPWQNNTTWDWTVVVGKPKPVKYDIREISSAIWAIEKDTTTGAELRRSQLIAVPKNENTYYTLTIGEDGQPSIQVGKFK